MAGSYGPQNALDRVIRNPLSFFGEAFELERSKQRSRYTRRVLLAIAWFFALELVLSHWYLNTTPVNTVSYFFIHHPWLVWPVAPFLHRGVFHFIANAGFLYLAAPIEQRITTRQYLLLLVCAGFLAVYADGVKLALLRSQPHVAAYGASGLAYGLLGYGLSRPVGTEWELTPREWLIAIAGVAACLAVARNCLSAIGDPLLLNIGHLGGLVVGVLIGYHNHC